MSTTGWLVAKGSSRDFIFASARFLASRKPTQKPHLSVPCRISLQSLLGCPGFRSIAHSNDPPSYKGVPIIQSLLPVLETSWCLISSNGKPQTDSSLVDGAVNAKLSWVQFSTACCHVFWLNARSMFWSKPTPQEMQCCKYLQIHAKSFETRNCMHTERVFSYFEMDHARTWLGWPSRQTFVQADDWKPKVSIEKWYQAGCWEACQHQMLCEYL